MNIEILVNKLKQWSQDYYELGVSEATDKEFDDALESLRILDPENPILTEVGHGYKLKGIDDKEKFEHPISVGSIVKTKELSELKSFINSKSTFSTKIDGNSVVAYYKNGKLFKVVTRGSDNIGIDRTAKFISILPSKIPLLGYVAVRGEAAIKKNVYTLENGFDVSKASRNAVAGAISRKEDYLEVFKFVDFIAYTFIDCDSKEDLYSSLDWSEYFKVESQKPIDDLIFTNILEFQKKYKTDYEYDSDGIVFKTDGEYLAFKFEDETAQTPLSDVEFSIGKDQRLTPVGILEPIELGGAKISRASLGSYQNAVNKGCIPLKKNHIVEIIRANEIIPYITKTISGEDLILEISLPKCPVCGSISIQEGEHVFCRNPECDNLNSSKLYNFSSHFYPEGLSDKIVEKFFDFESIEDVFDLLEYENDSIDILNIPGIGDSHKEKIYQFLKAMSKEIDVKIVYDSFLNSCGERAASKIVDSGFDLLVYLNGNEYEITKLNSIPNFNSNIVTDLVNKKELLKKFVTLRKIKQEKKLTKEVGTFVITGIRFKGTEAETVKEKGWKEGSAISKNTNVLVVKDVNSTSSKTTKAKELGIKIMTVDEFLEFI